MMVSAHSVSDGEYQLIHGTVEISDTIADATSLLFYIERNKGNKRMYADNISMRLMDEIDTSSCADQLVVNGDLETGDTRHWDQYSADDMDLVTPGFESNYALHMIGGSARIYIQTDCMQAGDRFAVSSKFKLVEDGTGNEVDCTVVDKCPTIKLRPSNGTSSPSATIGYTIGKFPSSSGWNDIFGIVQATDFYQNAISLRVEFSSIASGHSLIVDDVSVSLLTQHCDELILNGDMELGHRRFWDEYGAGFFSNVAGYNSTTAIRYSGRTRTHHGPEYEARHFMDYGCLTAGSTWRVKAQIKLLQTGTDIGASCSLTSTSSSTRCPRVRVRFYSVDDLASNTVTDEVSLSAYALANWDANGFNLFDDNFTVPATPFPLGRVLIIVRDFGAENDVVLDDFSITPVV